MIPDVLFSSKLEPLTRISPSKFTSLQTCPLREIWAANNKPKLLPISPAAYLGTVVHKLIELGSQGRIKNEEEMLACWETIVKDTEKEIHNDALEKYFIPLSLHANNY